jgi:hypothetical protein
MVMLASAVFAKGTNASRAGLLRFIFCHFDRPISLGSFQNYRRETLHAQVPPEVLTQTSLQRKKSTIPSLPSFRAYAPYPTSVAQEQDGKARCSLFSAATLAGSRVVLQVLDTAPQRTEFRHPKWPCGI